MHDGKDAPQHLPQAACVVSVDCTLHTNQLPMQVPVLIARFVLQPYTAATLQKWSIHCVTVLICSAQARRATDTATVAR